MGSIAESLAEQPFGRCGIAQRGQQEVESFRAAARTIHGFEMVNMIRKGQVRWLAKSDIVGQVAFVLGLFGLGAAA
jgi:hypothetical protein